MTLHALAQLAGVSPSVASTALSGNASTTRLSAKTRERIRVLAEKHGYCPNPNARAVRASARITAFVSTRWDNAYENDVKRHVHAAWKSEGRELQFLTWCEGPDDAFLHWLASWNYPRVILFDLWRQLSPARQKRLAAMFERVLVLQRGDASAKHLRNVSFCDIDTTTVMRDVYAYVRSRSRTRFAALVTEKAARAPRSDALRRLETDSAGAFSYGRDAWEIPLDGLADVHRIVGEIAATGRYDVLFAHHDQLAPVVYKALHDAGLRVPQEMAVIGMDDIPQSEYLSPPLTTVRIHRQAFGEGCLRWINGDEGDFTVPHALVPRESA